jgi:PKD repeat protein
LNNHDGASGRKNSNSSRKQKAAVLSLTLLMIGGILIAAAPSAAMAQPTQQQTTTAATTGALTPEEQQEQDRLQRTTAAITQNLAQGEKEENGVVYTPRWSDPVWVQPNSLSLLFVYCFPGEFADSGQEILGGSELNVLESYSVAVTSDLTGWLMVVQNENQTDRLPAAVGVICSSDANNIEARTLSTEEQIQINNIIKQFLTIRNTVINNITQVINIINNVTNNGTGGVTPPPTNNTGGNNTGGNNTGGATALRASIGWDVQDGGTAPALYELLGDVQGGTPPYIIHWDFGDGTERTMDGVPTGDVYHTFQDPGNYTVILTATDATGQTASDELSIGVPAPSTTTPGALEVGYSSTTEDGTEAPVTWCFQGDAREGVPPYTSFSWDFGDGGTATGQNVCHTFEQPGTIPVTLTVTDSTGSVHSETGHITVDPPLETTTPTTNETAAAVVTPPPTTGGGEETGTTPETPPSSTTTGGGAEGGAAANTDATPETPSTGTEGGGTGEASAGTTGTEGGGTTTNTPSTIDTLGQ